MIIVSDAIIDAAQSLSDFEAQLSASGDTGAIVSFSGRVRANANAGTVTRLTLQAYSPMTEDGIASAVDQAKDRWPLTDCYIQHRIGDMQAGETIVFVATASAHRRAAFEAADFLMDYLKTKAVFWKQEKTEAGAQWIEPRDQDHRDAARWQ